MKTLAAAMILTAIAAAPSTARDRNHVPAATVTGSARSCIPLRAIRDSQVRSDSVIDFMTSRDKGYRVTIDPPCPGLGFDRAFSYKTSLSQLCAQDIITVLRQDGGLTPGASCGLAPFQPIQLVPTPRPQSRR